MTDKEKIRGEITRLQNVTMDKFGNFVSAKNEGAYHTLCDLEAYIDSFAEESESKDLKEAAENCYYHNHAYATESFIEGANWQKQQMIDKACKWIAEEAYKYFWWDVDECFVDYDTKELTEDFRKAMEE